MIRVLAIESVLQEQQAGAIPPRVLAALRVLSDYKEARQKKYYQGKVTPEKYQSHPEPGVTEKTTPKNREDRVTWTKLKEQAEQSEGRDF